MKMTPTIIAGLAAVLMAAFVVPVSARETVNVALFSWPGYGFWFIAKEKNLVPDLDLDIQIIEDPYETFAQMAAGKIDVCSSTVEYGPIAADSKTPVKMVSYVSPSYGSDKILLSPKIKDVKDLKGQSVAVLEGGLTQIFMGIWLEQNGLKFDDVKYVNVIMDDAVAAMVSGKVAAGEFWEPFGGKVRETLKGTQVKANSSEKYYLETGLIADGIYMSDKFLADKPELAKKALRAFYAAVAYWKKNPEEGNQIIAKGLKFSPKDVADVLGTDGKPLLGGLCVFDFAQSARFLGLTPGELPFGMKNGQIKDHWALTTGWWKKFGLVKGDPKFEQGIDLAPMTALAKETP